MENEREVTMDSFLLTERGVPLDESWDVIVVGGGPAGCAAATASAREGARTLLIEMTGALGGMGTLGLVPWFCGYSDGEVIIARGLAERVLSALRDNIPHLKKALEINPLHQPAIDPELLKRTYDDLVTQAGAEVLFNTQLASVEMSDKSKVNALIVTNKGGLQAYKAKVYVDCTGDGDLAAWAGASFEKGDDSGRMQPATHCFAIGHIDEYALANGPRVHFFDPDSPIHKAVQSDNYPDIIELHSCNMQIGPGTFGFNTGHVFDVDNTDPASVSSGLIHGRKMAAQYRNALAEYHPAFANSLLVATGGLLGARETRRIIGDYVITIDDFLARRGFPDEICRNGYGLDIHTSKEYATEMAGKSLDEVRECMAKRRAELYGERGKYSKGDSFGVPYRCLTPKGLKNVLVAGRCISTDRLVNGSVRIMACCLTTGEAAGVAAAVTTSGVQDVHEVDVNEVRRKLKAHGAYFREHQN
jgi:glycine/D-amino acid oxidase-like deaminating enzyme